MRSNNVTDSQQNIQNRFENLKIIKTLMLLRSEGKQKLLEDKVKELLTYPEEKKSAPIKDFNSKFNKMIFEFASDKVDEIESMTKHMNIAETEYFHKIGGTITTDEKSDLNYIYQTILGLKSALNKFSEGKELHAADTVELKEIAKFTTLNNLLKSNWKIDLNPSTIHSDNFYNRENTNNTKQNKKFTLDDFLKNDTFAKQAYMKELNLSEAEDLLIRSTTKGAFLFTQSKDNPQKLNVFIKVGEQIKTANDRDYKAAICHHFELTFPDKLANNTISNAVADEFLKIRKSQDILNQDLGEILNKIDEQIVDYYFKKNPKEHTKATSDTNKIRNKTTVIKNIEENIKEIRKSMGAFNNESIKENVMTLNKLLNELEIASENKHKGKFYSPISNIFKPQSTVEQRATTIKDKLEYFAHMYFKEKTQKPRR